MKKVHVRNKIRDVGDYGNNVMIGVRINKAMMYYDAADGDPEENSGKMTKELGDYGLDPRDEVFQCILQPSMPLMWPDKKSKGYWNFSITWMLRLVMTAGTRPERTEESKEEYEEKLAELFKPAPLLKPGDHAEDADDEGDLTKTAEHASKRKTVQGSEAEADQSPKKKAKTMESAE
jgi:hypothetical protein